MTEIIIAALVAGLVSLLVSMLTIYSEKNKIKSEEKMLERELHRRLTEKLLDLRLAAYPRAFAITDKLRSDLILSKSSNISTDYIRGVLSELLDWQRDCAGFLFTDKSLKAYRKLREALSVEPSSGDLYSKEQLKNIFNCKNVLRGCLKHDLTLLYNEDIGD